MGYTMANGRWAATEETSIEIAEGDTESETLEVGAAQCARLVVTTALEGTDPGATITVRGRQRSADSWVTLATLSSVEDGDVDRLVVAPMRQLSLAAAYTGEDGGDVGDVDQTTGTGPGFTISGTPIVSGTLVVTISTGGAPGTAEFDWDLDELGAAGVAIPTTPFQVVLTGTGLTLTFENDTFVEGDEFEAEIVASAEDTTGTVVATVELVSRIGGA